MSSRGAEKLERAEGQFAARVKESVGADQGNVGVGGVIRWGQVWRRAEGQQGRTGKKRGKRRKGCQQGCHTVIPSNLPSRSHGARQRTASDTFPGQTDAPISTPVAKRPTTSPKRNGRIRFVRCKREPVAESGHPNQRTSVGGKLPQGQLAPRPSSSATPRRPRLRRHTHRCDLRRAKNRSVWRAGEIRESRKRAKGAQEVNVGVVSGPEEEAGG